MKKIIAFLIVGTLLMSMTSVSAIVLPKADNLKSPLSVVVKKTFPTTAVQTFNNGSFTGQFAKKNESGYVILGSLEGTYSKSSNYTGSFEGNWNTTTGSASGNMSGWFWGPLILGQIQNSTGESNWFIGLYHLNTTSSEFSAVAIIMGSWFGVRYAVGTYT
ncbi:MAG: hypothetical protein JSW06_03615 [Thermoplasmatales archaeon]|nr:MAG: hypothetical protein JSW06_03615 [Thermoplasmatales archaeon]